MLEFYLIIDSDRLTLALVVVVVHSDRLLFVRLPLVLTIQYTIVVVLLLVFLRCHLCVFYLLVLSCIVSEIFHLCRFFLNFCKQFSLHIHSSCYSVILSFFWYSICDTNCSFFFVFPVTVLLRVSTNCQLL